MNPPRSPLAEAVAAGWDRHAEAPGEVAAECRARAATLPADADGAAAIALAEHVGLAHLHDEAGFAAFLSELPAALSATEPTAGAVRRACWVLAAAEGADAGPGLLPDAARWRALQNLWALWSERGRAAEAQAMLAREVPAALAHDDAAARRALAATCNNLAADLRDGRRGDAPRDGFMLALAEASRTLWASAGTWVHVERAEYQLARCHAVLGRGAEALAHARACLALLQQQAGEPEADDTEFFFAHEALAWAQQAAGDMPARAAELGRMRERLAAIADEGLRAWCRGALTALETAGPASG